MRAFLFTAALFLLPAMASAAVENPRPTTFVEPSLISTMTCTTVSIASATVAGGQASQVITSTQTLWGSVTIQNRDSSVSLYVSDNVNVASGTANGTVNVLTGFQIAGGSPGGSASFLLPPGQLLYVVNDSGSRVSAATVCKGR